MPHQCTNCGRAFVDGSKQMLSGCPDCGGNKFQFLPERAVEDRTDVAGTDVSTGTDTGRQTAGTEPDAVVESGTTAQSTLESHPSATSERGPSPSTDESRPPAERSDPDADIIEAPAEPVEEEPDVEDHAQASARRSVVTDEELPPVERPYGGETPAAPTEEPDRPDLAQLRQELNEQFESIKILRPGEYELNLMELYDRDEYIIALEEDGRYVIDVPDSWDDPE